MGEVLLSTNFSYVDSNKSPARIMPGSATSLQFHRAVPTGLDDL